MTSFPRLRTAGLLVTSLLCSACITINIYFPQSVAEKVADKILDDVWQIKDDAPSAKSKSAKPAPAQ